MINGTMRHEERQREISLFHLEERKLRRSLFLAFSYLIGREDIKKVLQNSSWKCTMKGPGQRIQVVTGEIPSCCRKIFCTVRMVKH